MIFFSKILKLLIGKEKVLINSLLFFIVISMLMEVIGIGVIIPLISSLLVHEELSDNLGILNDILFIDYLSSKSFNFILIIFGSVIVIKNIFIYFTNLLNSFTLNKISARLSNDLFKNFLLLPYEDYVEKKNAEMINTTSIVAQTFKETLANIIILITEVTVFTGIIIFLIILQPILIPIITLIALVISFLFYKINKNILTRWGEKINKNKEEKLQVLIQSFNLNKNIKLSKNYEYFFNNYNFFNDNEYKYTHFSTCISSLPKYLFEIFGIISIVFSITIMKKMNIDANEIIIILSVLGLASLRILPAIARITNSISLIRFYKYSLDLISEELLGKKVEEKKEKISYKKISFKKLEFFDLSFQRKNRQTIFKDINFKLNKGDNIGIKGLSGSGKTTFVDIISGLLKPSKGKIILNETNDISKYPETTPIKIGYVPQNVFLSSKSINENIAFGVQKDKIDKDRLIKIMELCNINEFITSGSRSLDNREGSWDKILSGGEIQRIGIARAIYNNPDLLIFDEFTSSLDSKTELNILENLDKIIKDKTSIFISHKESTLKNCDKIYELKDKKIYEL